MEIKKVLITGITGFVGSHMAEYIISQEPKVKVLGLSRWRSPKENIKQIADKITLCWGDLTDLPSLEKILRFFPFLNCWAIAKSVIAKFLAP